MLWKPPGLSRARPAIGGELTVLGAVSHGLIQFCEQDVRPSGGCSCGPPAIRGSRCLVERDCAEGVSPMQLVTSQLRDSAEADRSQI